MFEIGSLNIQSSLTLLELSICAMEPVLQPQPAIAGVELEMVEVVEFWRETHREMVSGVVIHNLQTINGSM